MKGSWIACAEVPIRTVSDAVSPARPHGPPGGAGGARMIELSVVQGRPSGKRLEFPPGDYLIGRGVECHVRPESDWMSRQHCRLRVARDGASICDLGSRNGTLVNGSLVVGERPLK